MEALRAFSTRSKAARVAYRQPLSDFLADELLLHLVELSLDLRQRGDVARANPALPQGVTLLAERLAALLLALLGHCGSGAAGCALVAKLEPKLFLQSCMSTSSAGNPLSSCSREQKKAGVGRNYSGHSWAHADP